MNATSQAIRLVTAADAGYVPYLSAMLTSVRHNLDSSVRLDVTVLTRDLDPKAVRWPNRRQSDSLRCVAPDVPPGSVLPMGPNDHLTVDAYHRIFMESAFEHCVKRIVYLDSDLVVLDDLSKLASVDLGGRTVGAVMDYAVRRWGGPRTCPALKLQIDGADRGYFNSGVMVIDLDAWRSRGVKDSATRFLLENSDRIYCWDQDALNYALADDWCPVDPRWNRMCYWDRPEFEDLPFPADVMASLADPFIIHFTGRRKPWNDNYHEAREHFDLYVTMAGFGEHRMTAAKEAWYSLRDWGRSCYRRFTFRGVARRVKRAFQRITGDVGGQGGG
jgi:lipopolysaccharide biosynthesis glycosyltransferase